MPDQRLETSRLILRRWRDDDFAPFAEMCADKEVMEFIGDGSVKSFDETRRSIIAFERAWDQLGYGLFAVELKETAHFVGFTGFAMPTFLPEIMPATEIGWRFSRAVWGDGIASEAAVAAMAFARESVGLTDIVSICQSGNVASKRIMQKLGMVFDRHTIDPTCQREVDVFRLPLDRASS